MATQFPIPEDNRLRIPSIGVLAPMVLSTVPSNGQLANATSPDEILYYDFRETASLGQFGGSPGNGTLVLYGKVDEGTQACKGGTVPPPCAAVGWDFRRLTSGARIEVYWEKQRYVYIVVSTCYFDRRQSREFGDVLMTHLNPTLILMTDGGNFNRDSRSYSHTLFVRAALEGATIPPNCPPGMGVAPTPAPTPLPSATPPR